MMGTGLEEGVGGKEEGGWPPKRELFGVQVSATDYAEASKTIIQAAKQRLSATVDHMPVAGLMMASRDPSLRRRIDSFDMVAPDGQPVRWALNALCGTKLTHRVGGTDLMPELCRLAAEEGVRVYLYGSTPEVIRKLRSRLLSQYPALEIVGSESPPFQPLTMEEDRAVVDRINRSGAGLVFIGLGCPKQETFAYEHRDRIQAVQVCVGAAFDFVSGMKMRAPDWMQDRGLEWLFRLGAEPRRLWHRYFVYNSIFLLKFTREIVRRRTRGRSQQRSRHEPA